MAACCECKPETRTLAYYAHFRDYWLDPWNTLDWLSVALGFAILGEVLGLSSSLKELGAEFKDIGPGVLLEADERISRTVSYSAAASVIAEKVNNGNVLDDYYNANLRIFTKLDLINESRGKVQLLGFLYSIIIIFRFFKGFRGQPRIAIIALSMIQSAMDMAHFLVVFILIFANYSIGGWILFGPRLEQWNTLLKAMGRTSRVGAAVEHAVEDLIGPAVSELALNDRAPRSCPAFDLGLSSPRSVNKNLCFSPRHDAPRVFRGS